MPNIVTPKVIESGPRYHVVHLYLESDGTGAETTNYVVADRAVIGGPDGGRFAVDRIACSLSGFDALFSFDNLVDQPIWICTPLSKGGNFEAWPRKDSGGLDDTRKLLLSTSGLTSAGDRGTILIRIRKG